MSSSISKEKKKPVVTLRAQAEKLDYSKLKAGKDNAEANSGNTAFCDLRRMDFVINKKDIDQNFIDQLYAKHTSLIENNKNGKKNYRLFAKAVYKKYLNVLKFKFQVTLS